jgi:hypothetical protein
MSDEKSGPHNRLEGFDLDCLGYFWSFAHALIYDRERQEAHDEALASVQDSNSGHVEVCSVLYPDCADSAAG